MSLNSTCLRNFAVEVDNATIFDTLQVSDVYYTLVSRYADDLCGETMSREQEEQIISLKFWVTGLLSLVTGILGSLGNCLSLLILRQKEMRNIFNDLLSVLCLADLLVILTSVVASSRSLQISVPYTLYAVADGICHIATSASVFMTVSITAERLCAVCSPHSYQSRLASRGYCSIIVSYILPVIFLSVLFNFPRLLFMTSLGGSVSSNPLYLQIGIYSQVVHPLTTTCLLPLVLLSYMNYRIIASIRNRPGNLVNNNHSSQDMLLSRVMLTVVILFIILHSPRICLALYEVTRIPSILNCMFHGCRYNPPPIQWKVDVLVRYFVLVNSSINFIVYCMMGSRFRATLMKLLQWKQDVSTPTTRVGFLSPLACDEQTDGTVLEMKTPPPQIKNQIRENGHLNGQMSGQLNGHPQDNRRSRECETIKENGHENESGYCGNNSIITDTETKSAADINGQTVTGEEMDSTQKSEKMEETILLENLKPEYV